MYSDTTIGANLGIRSGNVRYGEPPFSTIMCDVEEENRDDLPLFLSAFAALAARMVRVDCMILNGNTSNTNVVRDLLSEDYLRALGSFTSTTPSSLWALLPASYGYDPRRVITDVLVRFLGAPSHGIENIVQLLQGLVGPSPLVPSLFPKILQPLINVWSIMVHYRALMDANGFDSSALQEPLRRIPTEAYRVFQLTDSVFQDSITKQVSALSQHVAEKMLEYLSPLLFMIASADENVTTSTLQKLPGISHELGMRYGPSIVELTWKFRLLKKCFTEGRMEIRVLGVWLMRNELINNVYGRFMSGEKSNWGNPVAQYIADFILDNKLVEYLVGVESHAQLIKHSGNIFAFLAVTQRYTEAETDAIWKAVCTSQDSRLVDAILQALGDVVPLAHYSTLLYFVTKLNELPLQSFDGTMITYAEKVTTHLLINWRSHTSDAERKMDMPPYQLFIRLIRQSAANKSLATQKQSRIIEFATTRLKSLLLEGPSDADLKSIYEDCVNDISEGTPLVTGSLSALLALVDDRPKDPIIALASTYGISSLVIGEFASTIETGSLQELKAEALIEHLEPRLNFLRYIIIYAPQSIDLENGQRLWDHMLGIQSLNRQARDMAWTMLAEAVNACVARNLFIDRCLVSHIPQLQPSSFATKHSLTFLGQVILYEARLKDSRSHEHQPRLPPSGIELLWHLSIVVPPRTIELEAIDNLVNYYLNLPNGQRSPRSVTESIYIEVVERCIRQLTNAASRLKACFNGVADSGDGAAVKVASEEQTAAHRLSFMRSLLIMKEFVKGARSRPTFSPPRQATTQIRRVGHDVKGRPMNLPYQTFNGSLTSGVLRLDVGDEETLEELSQRLRILSGFTEFTLVAGGRRLSLEDSREESLREMKINQNSFLLVKNSLPTDSATVLALVSDLKPLEGEIMKHFAILYDLLAMENGLAKEVILPPRCFGLDLLH